MEEKNQHPGGEATCKLRILGEPSLLTPTASTERDRLILSPRQDTLICIFFFSQHRRLGSNLLCMKQQLDGASVEEKVQVPAGMGHLTFDPLHGLPGTTETRLSV